MTDRGEQTGPSETGADSGGDGSSVAVALRYDLNPDHAPKIVATGRGVLAQNILEAALAAGIMVRKDADLAELLGAMDLGEDIPAEAFVAVAEVLRYVFEANGKLRILQEREGAME